MTDLFLGEQIISRHLFTPDECRSIVQQIDSLQDHWLKLKPDAAFFTLGAPAYQLCAENESIQKYHLRAIAENPLLWEQFSSVYQKLGDLLFSVLGIRAGYYFSLALPGFHIFPSGIDHFEGGDIHCDISYYFLDTPEKGVAHREHISIVVPFELPSCDCGIEIWEPRVARFCELDKHVRKLRFLQPTRKLQYNRGTAVIFSGFLPHRISPYASKRHDARRITLQAHLANVEGSWVMYW